jgi:hypothetical protein
MNEDNDIFIFLDEDENKEQLELDFGSTMNDTITIKLDELMTTSTTVGNILTTNGTGSLNWSLPSSLSTSLTGGYTVSASTPATINSSNITSGWTTSPYSYDTITLGDYKIHAGENSLQVSGDANFEGDIKIKGKSLSDVLDNIEQRLAILHPNPELEDKWDRLKELGEEYRKLEKQILEGEQIWDILKK